MVHKDYEFIENIENEEYSEIFENNFLLLLRRRLFSNDPYLLIKDKTIDKEFLDLLVNNLDLRRKYYCVKSENIIFETSILFSHTIFINCKFDSIILDHIRFGKCSILKNCSFDNCSFRTIVFDECILEKIIFRSSIVKDHITFHILIDKVKCRKIKDNNFADVIYIKDIYFKNSKINSIRALSASKSTPIYNFLRKNVFQISNKLYNEDKDMYGYKVVHDMNSPYEYCSNISTPYIIKVFVPKDIKRILTINGICRSEEIIPIKIYNKFGNELKSNKYSEKHFFPIFQSDGVYYQLNKKSKAAFGLDYNKFRCCGRGINFYLSKREAINFIKHELD